MTDMKLKIACILLVLLITIELILRADYFWIRLMVPLASDWGQPPISYGIFKFRFPSTPVWFQWDELNALYLLFTYYAIILLSLIVLLAIALFLTFVRKRGHGSRDEKNTATGKELIYVFLKEPKH
jgi:hypothetical protein